MRKLVLLCGLVLTLSLSAFAQDGDAKAVEIVKKGRAQIGKEDKIKGLQNFIAEGLSRQVVGQNTQENPMELTYAGPDKLYQAVTRSFGPVEFTTIQVLNGTSSWADFSSNQPTPQGGAGGNRFGGPGGPGGGRGGGMMGFMDQATQDKMRTQDLQRILLAFFLAAPGVEYTYIGEAKNGEGVVVADIVGAKSADGVFAKLYFEHESHQLRMVGYKAKDLRSLMRGPGGPGGGQGGQGGNQGGGQRAQGQGGQAAQGGQGGQNGQMRREDLEKLPPEEREKRMAEMRQRQEQRMAEMKTAWEKAPEVDYQWLLADYKQEGGLNLPHKLTRSVANQPTEEWVLTKFKINDKGVKPEKFVKKEKAQ